jgi:hypothetical protein
MQPAVGGPGEPLAATSDPRLIDLVRLGSSLYDLGVVPAARTHFRDRADLVAGTVPTLRGAEAGSGDSRRREAEKYARRSQSRGRQQPQQDNSAMTFACCAGLP